MTSKLQNFSFVLSFVISCYLLIFGVPREVRSLFSALDAPEELQQAQPAQEQLPSFIPFSAEAIKIKGSGEDPLSPDEDLKAYLSVRESFERRFGNEFDQAWEEHPPVSQSFEIPEGIEDIVNFWIHVFGKYGRDHYVFHHADDVSLVYAVIDLSDLDSIDTELTATELSQLKNQYVAEEKLRIIKLLKQIANKIEAGKPLDKEEKRIANAFEKNKDIILEKSWEPENLRLQRGFAHRFKTAIEISGKYMEEMENIFSMKGLPIELTRLPIIESAFNIQAYSSADAAGLWQFIPDTGKRYLKIEKDVVDERLDPILATYAAAQHLQNEYNLLKSWPLTINAYNTGPGRMLKARKELQTDDIAIIIKKFKGSGYKFYSRNYFPEFLAAVHVYENQEHYFGEINKMAPVRYDLFASQQDVNLRELALSVDVSAQTMKELNPHLSQKILSGKSLLPPGNIVRVPQQLGRLFASAAISYQKYYANADWHIVDQDETIESIAKSYGITSEHLATVNHYLPGEAIPAGTLLEIPHAAGVALNPEEPNDDEKDSN